MLLGPNSHNVNKHVLKTHPTSPVILRCSMCSDFRTMRQDELESHTRSCLGRTAPMPTLPMGAPVISLPTAAVVAETAPEPSAEPLQEVVMVGDVAVLPLVHPASASAGVLRMLTVEEIDQTVESYIVWRGQVGSTEHERVVKKAIIDTPVKRTKLRTLLRRIFAIAANLVPQLFAVELDIRLLVDVEVVQALFQHQETHRLRGACVSNEQSPTADADEACLPAGVNEGRFTGGAGHNPSAAGVGRSPRVAGAGRSPHLGVGRSPSAAGVGSAAKYELRNELRKIIVFVMSRQSRLAGRLLFPEQHPAYHLIAASARYVGQRRKREQRDRMRFGDDDQRIMTGEEQAHVLAECQEQLNRLMGLGRRLTYVEEQAFTDYFVVALLSLLLGPRQEVLAHTTTMNLKPPRSLGNPRDTYYLQVSGHHLKDGPFSGAVPAVVTAAVTYYIQRVRPLTVGGPMFVGTNGLAREDFSTSTRRVTMAVLGRPITAHRFRHSQVTDELQRAEVTPEVRRDMAAHRGHSVQVQEQHYHLQRLERTQAMMQVELLRRAELVREQRIAVQGVTL